jgi:hypothetical protein
MLHFHNCVTLHSFFFNICFIALNTGFRIPNRIPIKPIYAANVGYHCDDSVGTLLLGAPYSRPSNGSYISKSGLNISYGINGIDNPQFEIDNLVNLINENNGRIF